MPKTIDYPRTSYAGAWEVAEVVDDTGGKCSIEACARKLNRKVSGSFKAILGSAVKFGLLTSKRELLTTTNLFRRIKHAYDKQEELLYHREAFLHPPLFAQISRKFRNKELPVQMFDIMLIREFGVEEINAQNVAKAFVEGARMAGILDERNIIADIDQLTAQQGPRRELASGEMPLNLFKPDNPTTAIAPSTPALAYPDEATLDSPERFRTESTSATPGFVPEASSESDRDAIRDTDPVSALFGLNQPASTPPLQSIPAASVVPSPAHTPVPDSAVPAAAPHSVSAPAAYSRTPEPKPTASGGYLIHIAGPGLDTQLDIQDVDDLEIVRILLDKIKKNLTNR